MSPCGCGGSGGAAAKRVAYEVKFNNGTQKSFTTSQDATTAIRQAGGGTMKAVPVR